MPARLSAMSGELHAIDSCDSMSEQLPPILTISSSAMVLRFPPSHRRCECSAFSSSTRKRLPNASSSVCSAAMCSSGKVEILCKHTSIFPISDILPQLFARLNHPDSRVRQTLVGILLRIGAVAPHALCFPVIVGATTSSTLILSTPADDEEAIDQEDDEKQEQVHRHGSTWIILDLLSGSLDRSRML
jgi:hypothetical protein